MTDSQMNKAPCFYCPSNFPNSLKVSFNNFDRPKKSMKRTRCAIQALHANSVHLSDTYMYWHNPTSYNVDIIPYQNSFETIRTTRQNVTWLLQTAISNLRYGLVVALFMILSNTSFKMVLLTVSIIRKSECSSKCLTSIWYDTFQFTRNWTYHVKCLGNPAIKPQSKSAS